MSQDGKKLIDTNILVYSINESADKEKRQKAKEKMAKGFKGEERYYITLQSLEEFITVSTSAIENPITFVNAKEYVQSIINTPEFEVLKTEEQNVLESAEMMRGNAKDYWDCLIASIAKSNESQKILTENTKDFQEINGIKAANPFN
jgi:predicted nucleic acid-binding protein